MKTNKSIGFMKRIVLLLSVVTCIVLSSCSFETSHCPAYSHHNKITKHGEKAQDKYVRRKI
ncbi:MAG TPA: hypothetical protein PLV21_15365 [Cyclobacteriaceae bacterium]|nr:hypothetical protein [Cyclobacteriaceae bacterium]HRJ83266.1 hypothetical protein [Cyclobacteriaceae bacterium]